MYSLKYFIESAFSITFNPYCYFKKYMSYLCYNSKLNMYELCWFFLSKKIPTEYL